MASSNRNEGEITIKGVLAYAAQLRHRAASARLKDPHVELYAPSVDTARKLCSQLGPAGAKIELATRARRAELRYEEEEERASDGRERLRRLQLVVADQERTRRDRMTLGERLDEALVGVALAPGVGSSRVDADRVSGGERGDGGVSGSRRDRQVSIALEDARRAVEALERLVERDRRRLVEDVAA